MYHCTGCSCRASYGLPNRIEPKKGVPRARIETRWCFKCDNISPTFTGQPYHYQVGDEPNSEFSKICPGSDFGRKENLISILEDLEARDRMDLKSPDS